MKLITLIFTYLFIINTGFSQDQYPPLKDQVTTLKLSQKLHARSQLGGMAVDQMGFIYVANFQDALWRIKPNGDVKLLSDGFYGSSGIAVDAKGNIYQANFNGQTIIKIDRFGNISPYIEEGLKGPVGMVFDKDNNLYVCNCNDNTIKKITRKKEVSNFAEGTLFNCPNGIISDDEGHLYVVNFGNNDIVKIELNGKASKFATINSSVDGNAHIAYLKNNFYVTRIKTNTVYKITSTGKVALFAGTGKPEITDGNALEASISRPNGIAVDKTTNEIFINNINGSWNGKQATTIDIRKITPISVAQIIKSTFADKGIEEGVKAYWAFQKDPMHNHENVGPELGSLGWSYMSQGKVKESVTVFTLLSETYPDRWLPWFYLGDVYKIIGQNDKSLECYKKSYKLNPKNTGTQTKIKELEATIKGK